MYLSFVVERAKKCLDFTATLYLVHLVFCCVYRGAGAAQHTRTGRTQTQFDTVFGSSLQAGPGPLSGGWSTARDWPSWSCWGARAALASTSVIKIGVDTLHPPLSSGSGCASVRRCWRSPSCPAWGRNVRRPRPRRALLHGWRRLHCACGQHWPRLRARPPHETRPRREGGMRQRGSMTCRCLFSTLETRRCCS